MASSNVMDTPWVKKTREWAFGKHRNYVFVPATHMSRSGEFARFFHSDHPVGYPVVLLSYGVFTDVNPRALLGIEDHVAVMADSGGFQVAKGTGTYSQDKVLDWQLRYADAGMILDIPPFNPKGYTTPTDFERSLQETRRSVETLLRIYDHYVEEHDRRDFLLYAVQQGASPEQLETWHREIVEPLIETGIARAYAIGGVVFYNERFVHHIQYYIAFARHMGHRIVHVLGVGGSRKLTTAWYMIAFANRFPDMYLSGDNSYASQISQNMVMLPPGAMHPCEKTGDAFIRRLRYLPAHCMCPVCREYRRRYGHYPMEDFTVVARKETADAIFAHNIYVMLTNISKADFLHAMGKRLDHDPYEAFEIGYDRYWRRHCRELPPQVQSLAGGCRTTHWW